MNSLAILGSTGSIGRSTLDVLRSNPGEFRVAVLSGGKNIALMVEQAREFRPQLVCMQEERGAAEIREALASEGAAIEVVWGEEGLKRAATYEGVSGVIAAVMGFAGFNAVFHAIQAGRDIALANKEVLVAGGELVTAEAKRRGVRLIPIDSEHNSIYQCLEGHDSQMAGLDSVRGALNGIRRIVLTASGGPFLNLSAEELEHVRPADALKHPNWKMGDKITIDSASMMNKGLEVIEAAWLFGLPPEQIDVLVHPQSIVHGLVEFEDNAVLAALAEPDMRIPISHALATLRSAERKNGVPSSGLRLRNRAASLDLLARQQLSFLPVDHHRFPALGLCYSALKRGGSAGAVLNAANEVAVTAYLAEEIGFCQIPVVVRTTLESVTVTNVSSPDDIVAADAAGRRYARQLIKEPPGRNTWAGSGVS